MKLSVRAQIITRKSYSRPLDEDETQFETWSQIIDRVISHQQWLWERALGGNLNAYQIQELLELRQIMIERKALVAGRTLFLGGTELSRRREASQFNCAAICIRNVYDIVDSFWLLLQGSGVGFSPEISFLNGFSKPLTLEIIRSTATGKTGIDDNYESFNPDTGTWVIRIGDSAEAWAKSIGKIMIHKYPAKKLILDFSQIRPAGTRLKGYGWISSGDTFLVSAYTKIVDILNQRVGEYLSKIDILDIINHLGTTLSSRRSAQIAIVDYGSQEWKEFATAKKRMYENGLSHREQSNNSLNFWEKPSLRELKEVFDLIIESGGSEPGIFNGEHAKNRAPWFKIPNPCGEKLLADGGLCNLMEVNLARFNRDLTGLKRVLYLIARANYRQSCVNLRDGILQEKWHENNEFLHLCGVGLTGIAISQLSPYMGTYLARLTTHAAYTMADELKLPHPRNVTTVKPSGTMSKIMDAGGEGMHRPIGRYVFNNINFSRENPIVNLLVRSGYKVINHPLKNDSVLVTLPVHNQGSDLVDNESAISQLERYRTLMNTWCHDNVSCTIYYQPKEMKGILRWVHQNWHQFIGVAFLPRPDYTKSAADLGYPYLPQEVVTEAEYNLYTATLKPVDIESMGMYESIDSDCESGVCPAR